MVDAHFHALAIERRVTEARQVQALRAEIRQERKTARRKTAQPTSCFDDAKFCQRVFGRAERREAILAQVKSGNYTRPKPKASATAKWRAAVAAKAVTMPRAAAIRAVEQSHPGLRQRMIAEANRK